MNKIDPADYRSATEKELTPDSAPNGVGVMLAVAAGTLCWAGLFLLFV